VRLVCAFLLALAACASNPRVTLPDSVTLPMRDYVVPVVPAQAGGESFDVLLDTGAARTAIDAEDASKLGLEVDWWPFPMVLSNGLDQKWVWHRATIDRLELGAARFEGARVPAFDVRKLLEEPGAMAAIVGQDLLRSVVLVVDSELREVELVPSEQRAAALERRWPGRTWRSLELDYMGGCPTVELDLGAGVRARMIVDTGAVFSTLPRGVLERLGTTVMGSATVSGRIGGARRSDLHVLEPVHFAGWDIAMAVPALESPKGLLGMDVLDLLPIAIDGPGRKLWIAEPDVGQNPYVETAWYQISRFGSLAPKESGD